MDRKELFKTYLKYILLNIFAQMAYACYTLVDTFFVSKDLGTIGLAALNLGFPMFTVLNGVALMIGIGGATKYKLARSTNNDKKANSIFTTSFILALIFSIIFTLLGLFLSKDLCRLLGADSNVIKETNAYLQTLLIFAPAFFMNVLVQSFIRNDNNPKVSSTAMVIGSISNIILDYIFIFPLRMGIFGAALATSLSPLISLIMTIPYFIKKKNNFSFIKLNTLNNLSLLSSGIPSFFTEFSSGLIMFLFNIIILKISDNVGVAAFGVISVVSIVVVAIFNGLSQGIQPLISENYAKDKKQNVNYLLKYSTITGLILSIIIYSIIFLFRVEIINVFNSEHDLRLLDIASKGIIIYFIATFFLSFNIVLQTYFTSINKTIKAQIMSTLRSSILLIPIAILLSFIFKLNGLWSSYYLTELIVSIIGIIFLMKNKDKEEKDY